jgi:hypothetical protein
MPSISRRGESPLHYMAPRSSRPAIRQAGEERRARRSAELHYVGRSFSAESWQAAVNPSVLDGEPTAPPRHPYEAVPPTVRHQGWEREGDELALWGGVTSSTFITSSTRHIHHIDAPQSKMHSLQGALRGERRDAMASGENSLLDLSSARPHIALLNAEEAAIAKATAELKAGTGKWKGLSTFQNIAADVYEDEYNKAGGRGTYRYANGEVKRAGALSHRARFGGNPSPTPIRWDFLHEAGPYTARATHTQRAKAGPRQSFGERLRPEDMRRFSLISEGVFRARLASTSRLEESGRAQRDMQLLLSLQKQRY